MSVRKLYRCSWPSFLELVNHVLVCFAPWAIGRPSQLLSVTFPAPWPVKCRVPIGVVCAGLRFGLPRLLGGNFIFNDIRCWLSHNDSRFRRMDVVSAAIWMIGHLMIPPSVCPRGAGIGNLTLIECRSQCA